MSGWAIRPESADDADAIASLTTAAFAGTAHSSGTEAAIVAALRAAGALTVSLVAVEGGVIVGHVAFSPVTVTPRVDGWFGLGPVSVLPRRQGAGIGMALVTDGLDRLRRAGAAGCVVLGDPAYYGRFGFGADPSLRYPDVPADYLQRLVLSGSTPHGTIAYHPAFDA